MRSQGKFTAFLNWSALMLFMAALVALLFAPRLPVEAGVERGLASEGPAARKP